MLASAKRVVIRSPKSKRPKTVNTKPSIVAEPSDSSDSEDYLPLHSLPLRLPVKLAAREEAMAAGRGTSGTMTQEERELK